MTPKINHPVGKRRIYVLALVLVVALALVLSTFAEPGLQALQPPLDKLWTQCAAVVQRFDLNLRSESQITALPQQQEQTSWASKHGLVSNAPAAPAADRSSGITTQPVVTSPGVHFVSASDSRAASRARIGESGEIPLATTSGELSTFSNQNWSTAPWVITMGDRPYPDEGGVATFRVPVNTNSSTVPATTIITIDVPITLSGMTFDSAYLY